MAKYWVVYDRETDLPVAHGDTIYDIVSTFGFSYQTFWSAFVRQDKPRKRRLQGFAKKYYIERVDL